jgi:hypothetical protein
MTNESRPDNLEDPKPDQDSGTISAAHTAPDKVVFEGDAILGYDLLGEPGRGGMCVEAEKPEAKETEN